LSQFGPFAQSIYDARYRHPEDKRGWVDTAQRVVFHPMEALRERVGGDFSDETNRLFHLTADRRFIPGGRYLYATGRPFHQVNNCVLLRCGDSREEWAGMSYKAEMSLMTGAGIGGWYGDCRPSGTIIRKTGGLASGPLPKMAQVNDTGRHIMQGGNRRSAIWAGLPWWHADIFEFIVCKDYSDTIKALKDEDWTFPAFMDTTNISVTLDDEFFAAYNGRDIGYEMWEQHFNPEWGEQDWQKAPDGSTWQEWATKVYWTAVEHMMKHGEPGFTVDTGDKRGEVLRNACTEITSADDSDVCNLGSLVLPRFSTPEQFGSAVRDAVVFLTAGSVYSHVPYERVAEVREKNRRLGLGLIGVHEFCIKHGVRYGTPEAFEALQPYMDHFKRALEYANDFQDRVGLSRSIGATAIAPNGTIGVVAESTPSGDPLFSAAEIREVKVASPKGDTFESHVVVDPTAKRMVEEGADPALIEDAATLAMYPERRLAMQAYIQAHTDHAVSSTVNLPHVINDPKELHGMGTTLMEYLPQLRGVTFYPDGARAGQPRTPCDLTWALQNEGVRVETDMETCVGGVCGV
jgi:ribonucleoside-diphosphate reductase alpha chain